jgi:hypothetical protein
MPFLHVTAFFHFLLKFVSALNAPSFPKFPTRVLNTLNQLTITHSNIVELIGYLCTLNYKDTVPPIVLFNFSLYLLIPLTSLLYYLMK